MLVISHISVYLAQVNGTFVFLVQLNFLSLCLKIIKYDLIVIESAAATINKRGGQQPFNV